MKLTNLIIIVLFSIFIYSCGKYSEEYQKQGELYFKNKQFKESIDKFLKAYLMMMGQREE